ncbi:radical SAM family heme chaperone HemW [Granulicella rosea]|nr:radical SAM family heme chaperone HemW [Granulicella rosea]
MNQAAGIYLSIPFCKAKCSFCNFASDVFAASRMQGYIDRLCAEIRAARAVARSRGAAFPDSFDSIYFGGGTPSLLEPALFRQIFDCLRDEFAFTGMPEITVECAPGQLSDATLEELQRQGMNRLSFGVQSFVDRETSAVGRLHSPQDCLDELARVGRAGVGRLALDLIVGLPHQTAESWLHSVDQAITSGVEHVSVYMLEVDEDSRLGREALAHGSRYHAPHLPDEDAAADWYVAACERLADAGIEQYEISNFARTGGESRHNLKYWSRDPYLGFGLDAHSMLHTSASQTQAVRWANTSDFDAYLGSPSNNPLAARFVPSSKPEVDRVDEDAAFEETMFLGLRLNRGIDLDSVQAKFGISRVAAMLEGLRDVETAGLVEGQGNRLRLTDRGRMVSNEVFSRLLLQPAT